MASVQCVCAPRPRSIEEELGADAVYAGVNFRKP